MKKITLAVLSFFLSLNIIAQEATDKGYVALSLGPSFPTGDYASTNPNNEKAGLANTGAIVDLSFAYRLGKYFGIAAVWRGQSNPIDKEGFESAATNAMPDISWNIQADPWSSGALLFGAYGSFPIRNSKTTFETRLLFGYMNATVPQLTITGSLMGISLNAISESKSAGGFALLLGGNFRFNVGQKISLLASMDIYSSSAEFQNVKTEYSDGSSDINTFTQEFSTVNLSFGIAYRLGTAAAVTK